MYQRTGHKKLGSWSSMFKVEFKEDSHTATGILDVGNVTDAATYVTSVQIEA